VGRSFRDMPTGLLLLIFCGKTEESGLRALRTAVLKDEREKDGMWGREIYI
jgi:hypothetical protein